ncbi:MAG: HD domain-containing protein [Chloroflexota bacterium]
MNIIEKIIADFGQYGHLEYGEWVNMREHMLQSAVFAENDGADDLMIAAAVLHDYGHFIHGLDEDIADHGIDGFHEEVGAKYLENYFIPEVTEPIRLHVPAKRYLCAVDQEYFDTLSPASVQSLEIQGGPYDEAGIKEFEANPHYKRAVQLRLYDDEGKVPGMETPDITYYRRFIEVGLKK